MDWIDIGWGVLGAMLGIGHAVSILRTARRPSATTAVMGVLRLVVVAVVLTFAAVAGGVLAAASGWAGGFAVTVLIVMGSRRLDRRGGTAR